MLIKENTVCYISEIGHNNFWYPTEQKVVTKHDCSAERMSWISGGDRVAIKILKSCLIPINLSESTTINISPPNKNDYTIVWIENK